MKSKAYKSSPLKHSKLSAFYALRPFDRSELKQTQKLGDLNARMNPKPRMFTRLTGDIAL